MIASACFVITSHPHLPLLGSSDEGYDSKNGGNGEGCPGRNEVGGHEEGDPGETHYHGTGQVVSKNVMQQLPLKDYVDTQLAVKPTLVFVVDLNMHKNCVILRIVQPFFGCICV